MNKNTCDEGFQIFFKIIKLSRDEGIPEKNMFQCFVFLFFYRFNINHIKK